MITNQPPDHKRRRVKPIEIPAPQSLQDRLIIAGVNSYLRVYVVGECNVIVTREQGAYHMSVTHPKHQPTWAEIADAWYACVPGAAARTGVIVLPPEAEYVNIHSRCHHVHEYEGGVGRSTG